MKSLVEMSGKCSQMTYAIDRNLVRKRYEYHGKKFSNVVFFSFDFIKSHFKNQQKFILVLQTSVVHFTKKQIIATFLNGGWVLSNLLFKI